MRIIPVRSLIFALAILILVMPAASFAQVSVSITVGPPALPVYEQPLCPGEDYIWIPGYWAYGDDDYFWVPGTWVLAPQPGVFWTPGYWAWSGDRFYFYDGYWGPHIGFYGGINYGYGYFGHGYEGGRWDRGHFYYNRSVNNVNVTEIHNVYNTTVINNTTTVNRVSYNGGNGGINERPTPQEEAAVHERHIPPVPAQTQHVQAARTMPQLRASANHGKPAVAATSKPGAFTERGVVPAKQAGAPYNPTANRAAAATSKDSASRGGTAVHPNDLPPIAHPAPPNAGNSKVDQGYQQQQERLRVTQDEERRKLQQKQDQDHERLLQQKADEVRQQQLELQHRQQTQQLEQRHANQQREMQNKQQPPPPNPSKPPKEGRPPTEKP